METKIYNDKSLRVPAIIVSIIGAALLVLISYVFVAEESSENRNATLFSLGVPVFIMFAALLAAWFLIKRRTVMIDSTGARVLAKRPFGEAEIEQFFWRDIAAVNLVSETTKTRSSTLTSYRLSVIAIDGREIFLTNKTWLDDRFKNLLADVGAATKNHLGYVWENGREGETRSLLASVPPFSLIPLDPKSAEASLAVLFARNAESDKMKKIARRSSKRSAAAR